MMPARVFHELVLDILKADKSDDLCLQMPERGSTEFSDLILDLSKRCEVSQEAARIRLESLGLARISEETMFG